jgi:ferrous iron transport protein B
VDFLHLPHYRSPNWKELLRYVWTRVKSFLRKAGTIIAGMAVLLWVLLTFPMNHADHPELMHRIEAARASNSPELKTFEAEHSSLHLKHSIGGRVGQALAPIFRPLGYDWRLTVGILASLAAREVFVSTIGTVFALEQDSVEHDSSSLARALRDAKNPDGTQAYSLATCLSLLVFFAFSLQCISTIGVARRETNSWKIPALMFAYMFVLAYTAAFTVFHVASLLLSA